MVHRIAPITVVSAYTIPRSEGGTTGGSYEVLVTNTAPAKSWLGTGDPAAASPTIVLEDGPNHLADGVVLELLGRAALLRTGDQRVHLEAGDDVQIGSITYRLVQL